jgi:hypothetical protein
MKVITKQALVFKIEGRQDLILRPSTVPVDIPDYIRDTSLYKLALSDGTVQEFNPAPAPKPEEQKPADPKPEDPKQDEPKQQPKGK